MSADKIEDRNCLSYWFPKLVAAGVPVPRTEIIRVEDGRNGWTLSGMLDNRDVPAFAPLADMVRSAADRFGYPCFLRTGQGSGKHQWRECCHVPDADSIPRRIMNLVEWSHLVDMLGLRHDVFAVREMLPVEPIAVLPRYFDMPLVMEVRAFVRGGQLLCSHPYWPLGSIRDGLARGPSVLSLADEDDDNQHPRDAEAARLFSLADPTPIRTEWLPLVEKVAVAFDGDGAWSVDVLRTRNGWYVTDMAVARQSFHYDGCDREAELNDRP